MTIALGLVLVGILLVYGGITGKSIRHLLMGDNQTARIPPQETSAPRTLQDTGVVTGVTSGIKLRVRELFYDPLNIAWDEGKWIANIGGHSDHVHVSFGDPQDAIQIIAKAQQLGLRVGENPYVGDNPGSGVHVNGSYHYQNFPGKINGKTLGKAIDVSGSSSAMGQFASWVKSNYTK